MSILGSNKYFNRRCQQLEQFWNEITMSIYKWINCDIVINGMNEDSGVKIKIIGTYSTDTATKWVNFFKKT